MIIGEKVVNRHEVISLPYTKYDKYKIIIHNYPIFISITIPIDSKEDIQIIRCFCVFTLTISFIFMLASDGTVIRGINMYLWRRWYLLMGLLLREVQVNFHVMDLWGSHSQFIVRFANLHTFAVVCTTLRYDVNYM